VHRLSKQLLERSQDAYLLALDLYNRPTIRYRVEGFCFLFTNAWELLLKAKIIEDTKDDSTIFYRKQRGQPRRSISLRDALKKVFPSERDQVRRNVEEIAELRDYATHLVVPELETVYAGIFQAGVLNYANLLEEWFEIVLTDRASPSMLTLVFDVKQIDPLTLQKRYGKEVSDFILSRQQSIEQAISQANSVQFGIPITYRVVLTKKPQEADIVLSLQPQGDGAGRLIEVPKDVSRTHPYLFGQVLPAVVDRLGGSVRFTQYDLHAILLKLKIKKARRSRYHYLVEATGTHLYSQDLVDLIVSNIQNHPGYLAQARTAYKRSLDERRRTRAP
jgi:hypothetical protein